MRHPLSLAPAPAGGGAARLWPPLPGERDSALVCPSVWLLAHRQSESLVMQAGGTRYE